MMVGRAANRQSIPRDWVPKSEASIFPGHPKENVLLNQELRSSAGNLLSKLLLIRKVFGTGLDLNVKRHETRWILTLARPSKTGAAAASFPVQNDSIRRNPGAALLDHGSSFFGFANFAPQRAGPPRIPTPFLFGRRSAFRSLLFPRLFDSCNETIDR